MNDPSQSPEGSSRRRREARVVERPLATLRITELGDFGEGLGAWAATSEAPEGPVAVRKVETVHVPGALPGELVDVRIYRRQGDVPWADLLAIREASPDRQTPPCALFGVCSGCQLQHLPYAAQLTLKRTQVARAFARAGLENVPLEDTVPCPRPLGYRSKLTPHFARPRPGEPLSIGFLKIGRRQDLVDVPACPLATAGVNDALPALRAKVRADADAGFYKRGATLLVREATSGVTTDSDALVTEEVGGVALRFFARDFFQNNPFLLPRMLAHVVARARATGATALVDTYCGSGLFALAAAHAFTSVLGVEVSASAVARATENAASNRLDHVRFVLGDASAVFAQATAAARETVVIVDPPRDGCSPSFLEQLAAFSPRAVIYVSCNPLTQARDVAWLVARGFALEELVPFDMFPQTRHLESVACLRGPV